MNNLDDDHVPLRNSSPTLRPMSPQRLIVNSVKPAIKFSVLSPTRSSRQNESRLFLRTVGCITEL